MILSKNGKSFIPISYKKSRMKIVTAPYTKFERGFFGTDDELPTKVRKFRCGGRKIFAFFFLITGHLTTVPLENQRTVNAEW